MGMVKEFKAFVMRGNVLDMAIGIVIGAAFGKIVSSFVSDLLMPVLGLLIGGVDFSDLKIVLKEAVMQGEEVISPEVVFGYGNFIQVVFDFLIIAFAIFMLIRAVNKVKKKKEEAAPAAPPADVQLLTEIRDLLKKN